MKIMNDLYKIILPSPGFFKAVYPLERDRLALMPLYLKEAYAWYVAEADGRSWLLAECPPGMPFSLSRLETQMKRAAHILGLPVILLFDQLAAYNRRRLMEKGIPFIVRDKQVYIPTYLVDLKEVESPQPEMPKQLTPMGQVLLFSSLLERNGITSLRAKSFKELAMFFQVKPMQITRAAEVLRNLGLIEENKGKEKFIRFKQEGKLLWEEVVKRELLIDPVIRRKYFDKPIPGNLPESDGTALSTYTDMNAPRQISVAVYKKEFLHATKNQLLNPIEDSDAPYCLELWRYDPRWLMNVPGSPKGVVDPLSLYVSMRHEKDARVEMALQQLIQQAIW